jgi:hypothetical protein
MKFDQRTGQAVIKSAMRQPHAPGKYDVFAWLDGHKVLSVTVAWRSFTKRSIALENVALDNGEEIQTNAAPLPNGIGRNGASYVGSFRIDKHAAPQEP